MKEGLAGAGAWAAEEWAGLGRAQAVGRQVAQIRLAAEVDLAEAAPVLAGQEDLVVAVAVLAEVAVVDLGEVERAAGREIVRR